MNTVPRSSRMEQWNHFLRWFFDVSPTALLEPIRLPTDSCPELRGKIVATRVATRF